MKTKLDELRAASLKHNANERETFNSTGFPKTYLSCLHTCYPEHQVSVWKFPISDDTPVPLRLSINDRGLVTVVTVGDSPDEADALAETLQQWVEGHENV